MTSYNLSSFAGAGAQFFDDNGNPLTGGKVYTYAAGTTTPAATYTTSTGAVANTNPIILDAGGRTANETWLVAGSLYKFIVKTSADVLVGTYDGLPAINDPYSINSLLGSVTGTNAIAAVATPSLTAYAAGATYAFIAANSNTAAATLSIDGLATKSITKNGSATLTAGDIQIGKLTWVQYDGTTFQLINNIVYGGSITNGTIVSLTAPLGAASGGTGLSTLTANSVLLGNGISAVQLIAPSTSGNVLTSNGTTWASSAPSPIPAIQAFTTTGANTFTIPAGVTKVKVTVVGGGGGGAGSVGSISQGGGGGAGGTAIETITGLTPGGTVTVTVGAGGAGIYSGTGTSGGTSSFGAYCSATGGAGGVTISGSGGVGGAGGVGSGGNVNLTGGSGGAGGRGPGGGGILGGMGATAGYDNVVGGNGVANTGGGGSASSGTGGSPVGGTGGSGIVIVEY